MARLGYHSDGAAQTGGYGAGDTAQPARQPSVRQPSAQRPLSGRANSDANAGYLNGQYSSDGQRSNGRYASNQQGIVPTSEGSGQRPLDHRSAAPSGPESHRYDVRSRDPSADLPRHITRHASPPAVTQRAPATSTQHPVLAPAPQQNYQLGRGLAGLFAVAGVIGIILGMVLVYALFREPALFQQVGIDQPSMALSVTVTIIVIGLFFSLLAAIAIAAFDAADSAADLVRIQRYRAANAGDEEHEP